MAETRARSRATAANDAPVSLGERPITLKRFKTESQFLDETKGLERKERDRYGSMLWNLVRLDFAPKVRIMDIVGPRADAAIEYGHEDSLRSVVDHYHGQSDRADLNRVLKFFAVYLMQRARREATFAKQQFLLFRAVDLLRMLTQFSSWCVHRDAEALVFGIFDDLGTQKMERYARYRDSELRIYPLMKKLHEVPRDFILRLELADELGRQTSFFDAFVQYDFLRRFYPRFYTERNLERRLGVIYSRMALLIQDMLDHLGKGYRDARKVNSFIERYNRSFATKRDVLVPFAQDGKDTPQRAARALRHNAEQWYRKALASKLLPPDIQIVNAGNLARNLAGERRFREAVSVLTDAYKYWGGIGHTVESLQKRIGYLEQIVKAGIQAGRRDQVNWATMEQRDHLGKLDDMVKASEEYKKRREEILKQAREGVDDEVPDFAKRFQRRKPGAKQEPNPAEE